MIVLGGPNGAGKSTAAAFLLPPTLTFINADNVAKSLPGYPSKQVDREAARVVLQNMRQLGQAGTDFAVETTLASRSLAKRIRQLKESGYLLRLLFLFLTDVELAIHRVAQRVREGGHDIPEETIRRRFMAGIQNLFGLYLPLADKWTIFETSGITLPRLIAEGVRDGEQRIHDLETWQDLWNRGHEA